MAALTFDKLETPAGIGKFNGFLATKSYMQGYTPSKLDAHWFHELSKSYGNGPEAKFVHARRWFNHIHSYTEDERNSWGEPEPEPEAKKAAPAKEKAEPAKKGGGKKDNKKQEHKEPPKEAAKKEEKNDADSLFDEPAKPEKGAEVDDQFAEGGDEPAAEKPKPVAEKPKEAEGEKKEGSSCRKIERYL